MRLAKSAKSAKSADVLYRDTNTGVKAKSEGEGTTRTADACNNTIKTRGVHSDFIFFGCWNNINCKKEYAYRDIVLDYIHRNENAIQQLYIAGDNWYQNKINNFKMYLTDVLITGYAKLYAMNKEVYIAVGNHDEDKDGDNGNKLLKKDCNINTQKYYLKQLKDGRTRENMLRPPTLEKLYYLAMGNQFADNSMCENGVYIYVDNIGVRYNDGNIVIIINTNRFDEYDTGLKYIRSIRAVIKRVFKARSEEHIFVMGHIPLFSFKQDTIKLHKINKKDERYDKMILDLFELFATHNIVYICADTHNFSIMKIQCGNKAVIQITAGTGGADPDVLQTEYAISPFVDENVKGLKYVSRIEAYALNPYGYVKIKTEKGIIAVCYTQIIKDGQLKPTVFTYTYRVQMDTKQFVDIATTSTAAMAAMADMRIYKNNVCSSSPEYITSINRKIVCYKKGVSKK